MTQEKNKDTYLKHAALNLAQAIHDLEYFDDLPEETKENAAKERAKSLVQNLFFMTVDPSRHHSDEELKQFSKKKIKDIFTIGLTPGKGLLEIAQYSSLRQLNEEDLDKEIASISKQKGIKDDVPPEVFGKNTKYVKVFRDAFDAELKKLKIPTSNIILTLLKMIDKMYVKEIAYKKNRYRLRTLIESLVDGEIDKKEPFDIEKLSSSSMTPQEKEKYAQKTLPFLNKGSSRSVFALDDTSVLKVARNRAGLAQNKAEAGLSGNPRGGNFVAKVYAHAPDFSWLKSEKVVPLTSSVQFEGLVGIPFDIYVNLIGKWIDSPESNEGKFLGSMINKLETNLKSNPRYLRDRKLSLEAKIQLDDLKRSWKSPFIKAMMGLVNRELKVGDVARIETSGSSPSTTIGHYGETPDGRIVLLDYGFTHAVGDQHYNSQGRIRTVGSDEEDE
jgi:hypothetical protein